MERQITRGNLKKQAISKLSIQYNNTHSYGSFFFQSSKNNVYTFYTRLSHLKVYRKQGLLPYQIRNYISLAREGLGVPAKEIDSQSILMKGTVVMINFLKWVEQYRQDGYLPALEEYKRVAERMTIWKMIKAANEAFFLREIERLMLGLKTLGIAHCDIKERNIGINYQAKIQNRKLGSVYQQDPQDFENDGYVGQLYLLDNDAVASYGSIRQEFTPYLNRSIQYGLASYPQVVCETTDNMGFKEVIRYIREVFSTPPLNSYHNICRKMNKPIHKRRIFISSFHKRTIFAILVNKSV